MPDRYSTVISAYCADSATDDRATWQAYMRHITGLVLPGGIFIAAELRRSSGYMVGGKAFPSARVDEDDFRAVLPSGPGPFDGSIQVRNLREQAAHGYSGIVLGWVRVTAGGRSGAERKLAGELGDHRIGDADAAMADVLTELALPPAKVCNVSEWGERSKA